MPPNCLVAVIFFIVEWLMVFLKITVMIFASKTTIKFPYFIAMNKFTLQ